MARDITRGIVKQIEPLHRFFSFVTLAPIEATWAESRVPVYMSLGPEYIGKPVDIITERRGFLGSTFKQTVEAADISDSTEMRYSLVKTINRAYRTQIAE